jgi:malic enzyme
MFDPAHFRLDQHVAVVSGAGAAGAGIGRAMRRMALCLRK